MKRKTAIADMALAGGEPLFQVPKSTSNLVSPDLDGFLNYSNQIFKHQQQTSEDSLEQVLESRLATLHDVRHCVTFCSGFWALVLAISTLALPGRTQVVMPSLTYRRMADVVAWTRLVPHFCEVAPDRLAITAETAAARINGQTALILAVHPIVNCCDVSGLTALAGEHGIPLLFDSVESVYETVPSGKVGKFGNAEVFSLHASKLINGFEGGYITTNDAALADTLRFKRSVGIPSARHQIMATGTMNARLNEMHAAMALAGLDDLDNQVRRNQGRYQIYHHLLEPIRGIRLLKFDEKEKTSFKNIVVELTKDWPLTRDETVRILNTERILARAYYSPPLHHKEMSYPFIVSALPITDFYAERLMLLPCGHLVDESDITAIAGLLDFIHAHGTEIQHHLRAAASESAA